MSIVPDILAMADQDATLARQIGLDADNIEQRFNLTMALKQIEAAALGIKEKPLEEIRKLGFDAARDSYGLGYYNLKELVDTGLLRQELDKVGLDSNALYGATELTYFDPRFYEIEHKPLLFREYFPITHESDPADTQYAYKMERLIGTANFTGQASNTHYKVDVNEEDTFLNIKKIQVEFEVTTDDMRSAIKTGRPIEVRKMKAAAKSSEQQMNDAVIIGSEKPNLLGFIKHPNIVEDEVADGAGGGDPKLWVNKTPHEIVVGDIGSRIALMRSQTFNLHSPTNLGLSIESYNHIAQTWMSDLNPITILQYMKNNLDAYGLGNIIPMSELSGAGPGGEEMGTLWKNEDGIIQIDIPQELLWLVPQWHGAKIVFIGEAKISDMILRRSQTARRFYGF